jgi:hypothetical protein
MHASRRPIAQQAGQTNKAIYDLRNGDLGHRTAKAIYYRARAGRLGGDLVRVSDVTIDPVRVHSLGSPAATHRVFIQPSEARWTYAFAAKEGREITPAALERQIGEAAYSQPDAARRNPR